MNSISLQDIYLRAENSSLNGSSSLAFNFFDTTQSHHLQPSHHITPARPHNKNDLFDETNLTYPPWLTVVIASIATLMSSMTIIGNVFVITAFIIDKNLRKYSNYFILNLSVADLLIGVLIPPYAPFLLYKRNWRLGPFACTVWLVLDYVVGSASVLCIVVISLDRYLLVSRGLNYVAGQKVYKAIILILTVWIIAFLNYGPAIIFWELISGVKTVKDDECQVAFHDNLVYLTATACVEFFVPLISICGLNLAVYLNIRKRSRGLIRSENPQFTLGGNRNSGKTAAVNAPQTPATPKDTGNRFSVFFSSKKSQSEHSTSSPKKEGLSARANASGGRAITESAADCVVVKLSPASHRNQVDTGRPFSVSASSTTCSTSSLDDVKPLKKKKVNEENKKHHRHHQHHHEKQDETGMVLLGDPETRRNDLTGESKPKSESGDGSRAAAELTTTNQVLVTQLSHSSASAAGGGAPIGGVSSSVVPSGTTTTMASGPNTYASYTPRTKKPNNNTSRTLTKDKKAARSLFILVFVFVICWVRATY
jgi:histamine receptor H3